MNAHGEYSVNIGTAEYQCWVPAKWLRTAEIIGFHVMRVADPAPREITVHKSNINHIKPSSTALEDDMRQLLKCDGLLPDAKKLIEAALEAQSTGKRPALDFWI